MKSPPIPAELGILASSPSPAASSPICIAAPLTIAQYAGFGSASESNQRLPLLIDRPDGFLAFDSPPDRLRRDHDLALRGR